LAAAGGREDTPAKSAPRLASSRGCQDTILATWRIPLRAASLTSVTAIVGLVLPYVALLGGQFAATPIVGVEQVGVEGNVCAAGDACEISPMGAEPTTYATPSEVDCRALAANVTAASLEAEVSFFSIGWCQPSPDFRYRVSRFADSERPSGALGPQRSRRAARSVPTCAGLPPDHGGLARAPVPPIALYAVMPLPPPALTRVTFDDCTKAPTRGVEPLDRPPRT
jgi:hypothetical protein